jgi:medium-chain acyl-[acyl-carrier-protein] hydrolase
MTASSAPPSGWLRYQPLAPASHARLLCFPHAGGGASSFSGWSRKLPAEIELIRLQLPGREDNVAEPPFTEIGGLAAALAPQLAPLLSQDVPLAFYGHSMGAILAFELTRELRRRGEPLPFHLFVSGRRAPQLPLSHARLYALDDPMLIEYLRRMGGVDARALDRPAWLRRYFPTMRADLEVSDLYRYRPEPPLPVPISAFNGSDDPTVPRHEWLAWREQTSHGFAGQALSGRHFFDRVGQDRLIASIVDVIRLFAEQTAPTPMAIGRYR